MQDISIMPIPMAFAMTRDRQGVDRRGREARHESGETSGDGSVDQAQ